MFEEPKDTFIKMSDKLDTFASKLADLGEVQVWQRRRRNEVLKLVYAQYLKTLKNKKIIAVFKPNRI
jgi:hypothetical protein